jgi:hypothetical protein
MLKTLVQVVRQDNKGFSRKRLVSFGGGSYTTSVTMTHFMDFVNRDHVLQEEICKELCAAFPGGEE